MIKEEELPSENSRSDSSSDDESLSSSQDSVLIKHNSFFDAVLRFHIDIDPITLEQRFSLSLMPRVRLSHDPDASLYDELLYSLKLNTGRSVSHDKPFFDACNASTPEDIARLITMFANSREYELGDTVYHPDMSGMLTGDFVTFYFNQYYTPFDNEAFPAFLSFIDLLMRNKPELTKLEVELDYQKNTYGLTLKSGQLTLLKKALSQHPVNQRQAELERYRTSVQEAKSSVTPQKTFFNLFTEMAGKASGIIQNILKEALMDDESLSDLSETDDDSFSAEEETSSQECSSSSTESEAVLTLTDSGDSPSDDASEEAPEETREAAIANLYRNDSYGVSKAEMKKQFDRLFESRKFFTPTIEFYNQLVCVAYSAKDFWLNYLSSDDHWDLDETKDRLHALMMNYIILTDSILADLELFLTEAGQEVNDDNVVSLLGNEHSQFRQRFIDFGVADFYQYYRQKVHFKVEPNLLIGGRNAYAAVPEDMDKTNEAFFNRRNPEFRYRQYYNYFMTMGLLNRYSQAEASKTLAERLPDSDYRVGRYNFVDKKVYSTAANPTLWKRKSEIKNPANVKHTFSPPPYSYDRLSHLIKL